MKPVEVDVVIVSYAKDEHLYNLTKRTITSLLDSESSEAIRFNIFIVESQLDVNWSQISPEIKTISTSMPYGYHAYLNLGRKEGKSDWVVLANSDLFFTKNWMSEILESYKRNPSVPSFSPLCTLTQPQYGIFPNTGDILGYQIRRHISGWCIVQRRDIYDNIGDLDERFRHWFCDNDYSMTLYQKKIPHMLVTKSLVEHHSNITGKTTDSVLSPEKKHELTYGAGAIFQKKWEMILNQPASI